MVGTGRARELPAIVDRVVELSAAAADKEVAEVRSAVPLTDDQRPAWPTRSARRPASSVEVKVVVDPSVMGGLVAQVGDTVIDGSVRHRLEQLRDAL